MPEIAVPRGYRAVEHADGIVHAITWDDAPEDGPLWRTVPVCGTTTGVSSDEAGQAALDHTVITCSWCISIVGD